MNKSVWGLSTVLETHGIELTVLLLELYGQIGLTQNEIEFADATGKLNGFDLASLTPGSHVRIHWKPEAFIPDWEPPENLSPEEVKEFCKSAFCENGYIFTLPSMEDNDATMAGVVHIPSPNNPSGKGEIDPQWLTLNHLISLDTLDHIELIKGL